VKALARCWQTTTTVSHSFVQAHERGGLSWLSQLGRDLRDAGRQLRRTPGFAALVVGTVALGVGASTAVFSVVSGVLLQPLRFDRPEQLVQVWEGPAGAEIRVSGPTLARWSGNHAVFEHVAACAPVALNLTGTATPERLRGLRVSAAYLKVFRLAPLLGRGFEPSEDVSGQGGPVVLAHGLWQRAFGGDPGIVGRVVRLGGVGRIVIGVLPAVPHLPGEHEFLVPLGLSDDPRARSGRDRWLQVVARLKPGVSVAQARAALGASSLDRSPPRSVAVSDSDADVVPLRAQLTGDLRPRLWILFGAAACLLLIACSSVASLLIAKGLTRRRELAVRVALGAGRGRIVRQLLTESLLLALLGGVSGTLLATAGVQAWIPTLAKELPRATEIGLDHRVMLFALGASLLTGVAFGLAPALRAGRVDPGSAFRGARMAHEAPLFGVRGLLTVAQVAIAVVLLAGAGLVARSLWRLMTTSPGFDPAGVLGMTISLDPVKYPDHGGRLLFWGELTRRLQALPTVNAVGMAGGLPLTEWNSTTIATSGGGDQPLGGFDTDYEYVGADYFRALRIPLPRGRGFGPMEQQPNGPRTAILSTSLARRIFPDRDAVGGRITAFGAEWEIVGIAGEVRRHGIDHGARDCLYLPQAYTALGSRRVIVRTAGPPSAVAGAIRAQVQALDPDLPVANLRTLEQVVHGSFGGRRTVAGMLGVFSGAALLLAIVGLYGLLGSAVAQRTRDIGIRMALGAQLGDVVRHFVRQGLKLTAAGVAVGLLGAWALSGVLRQLLFDTSPTDPVTLLAVTLLLAAVAAVACWLPARRAAKVDPVIALRAE
jgi:predicted permease